jgi:alpha-1,2-mannosyltransferase
MAMQRLTRERVLLYSVCLFIVVVWSFYALALITLWRPALVGESEKTVHGEPVGGDFVHYYAAAHLARAGQATKVYDSASLQAEIQRRTGSKIVYRWPYPPSYILLLLPLAWLPYFPALLVWLGLTLLGYLLVLHRLAPHPLTVWLALAFPGIYLNFHFGQNGCLSGLLVGGGLALLDRRPGLAGLVLGLMSYKPHLAVLIPVALAAGGHGRALAGAVLSAAALAAASLMVLGPRPWLAFLQSLPGTVQVLDRLPLEKMISLYAKIRLWGGSPFLGGLLQAALMVLVAGAVVWVWRRRTPAPERHAALVLGLLLFPPHAFCYDLALLALPLAWLGREFRQKARPYEAVLACIAFLMPFSFFPGWQEIWHLPVAVTVLAALGAAVLRRLKKTAPGVKGG